MPFCDLMVTGVTVEKRVISCSRCVKNVTKSNCKISKEKASNQKKNNKKMGYNKYEMNMKKNGQIVWKK